MEKITELFNRFINLEKIAAFMRMIAPPVTRIGLSGIYLWFGYQQLAHTKMWTSYVPKDILKIIPLRVESIVHANGAFELVFGTALILGLFSRLCSLLLAIHMFDVTFIVGFDALGMRDLGLAIASLSIFLYGPDVLSLENYLFKEKKGDTPSVPLPPSFPPSLPSLPMIPPA